MARKICDHNYTRHVGWDPDGICYNRFYSQQTVRIISKKITELTMGVHQQNRPIVVPDKTICNIMDSVFSNYTPHVGDIHTRYHIVNSRPQNIIQNLIDQTIEIIVSQIRDTFGIEQWNSSLTAWVQLYGDFNIHNLTQTPPIKIRQKRPDPMQFNMNY